MHRTPLAVLALLAIALPLVAAQGSPLRSPHLRRPKVVVVIVDSVTAEDCYGDSGPLVPGRVIPAEATLGLMVTRAARDQSPESTYLTIGCGARAVALPIKDKGEDNRSLALGRDEVWQGRTGSSLYRANTGRSMGKAALAQCRIAQMQRDNAMSDYQAVPGRLGSLLAKAGVRVACIGDADSTQALHRPALSLCMDENGLVPMGEVGASLHRLAPELPAGIATDFGKLQQAVDRYLDCADFLVIETGDTARIAELADQIGEERAAALRRAALERIDHFVEWLLERLEGKPYSLFVITPTGFATQENATYTLSPIIAYGRGFHMDRLLTSPSTRRDALVVNTDLVPTWLALFGIAVPPDLAGRGLTTSELYYSTLDDLHSLQRNLSALEQRRPPATRVAISVMMLVMGLATLLMLLGDRSPRWLSVVLRFLLPMVVVVPPLTVLGNWSVPMGPIPLGSPPPSTSWMLATVAVSVVIAVILRGRLLWLSALVMLALVVDALTGGTLSTSSVLSYSFASGARYYGIGNELGGVFIAITLVALLGWKQSASPLSRRALILIALAMIVVLALIGLPFFGANFGVMLGGAVAFGAAFARLCGARLTPKTASLGLLVVLLIIGGAVAADLLRGAGGSHIGRAFSGADHSRLLVIIGRKLATNWRVFQVSLWSRLLGLAVACLIAAAVWFTPAVRDAYERRRNLGAIMTGIGWGSAALFLFNDSGVVAAALCLTLGATWLTWCALERPQQKAVPKPSG